MIDCLTCQSNVSFCPSGQFTDELKLQKAADFAVVRDLAVLMTVGKVIACVPRLLGLVFFRLVGL